MLADIGEECRITSEQLIQDDGDTFVFNTEAPGSRPAPDVEVPVPPEPEEAEAGDDGAQGAEAEDAESADGGALPEKIEKGVD